MGNQTKQNKTNLIVDLANQTKANQSKPSLIVVWGRQSKPNLGAVWGNQAKPNKYTCCVGQLNSTQLA